METTKILNGIPPIYHNADISRCTGVSPVFEWIRRGKGFLFITGPTGTGKTFLSCAIKKRCNTTGDSCKLVFTDDLFLRIRDSFNKKTESEYDIVSEMCPDPKFNTGSKLAIFDDVGAQKISEFTIETWYNIINKRYNAGYKTIFTSNYSLREISELMSDRIASRIGSGMIFQMNGVDRRIEGIAERDLTKIY